MTTRHSAVKDWLRLVEAEYREVPGLHLTKAQIQRLWRLEAGTCDTVIETLVANQFLRQTRKGAYVLAEGGR
jgi:hypothetical protein